MHPYLRGALMRSKLLLMAAVVALLVASGLPVAAQNTTVTLTVQAGSLAVSVPAAADLGTGDPGDAQSGQIGVVTVTDERAALVASWTASVSSTTFTTGGGTAAETIPTSAVRYWSGPATATTGVGVVTPGQVAALNAVVLSAQRTAFSMTGGTGNNTAAWNPTLVIDIPAAAVEGSYTGTVTHTVL
jgi:hypothetical protein